MPVHEDIPSGRHRGMTTIGDPMDNPDALPQLLTVDQLATQLGTSVRHVRRLVTERRVPYVKVGRWVRSDPATIAGWLDQHRVEGGRPT